MKEHHEGDLALDERRGKIIGRALHLPKRSSIIYIVALAACILSFLIYHHSSGELVLSWQKRPVLHVVHEKGFAFQALLGIEWMGSHLKPSPAIVLENGKALGPGNSMHDDIRNQGQGRYSFWHDILYFSASDNSDPRLNKKQYEILWPRPIPTIFSIPLYLFSLLISLYSVFLAARQAGSALSRMLESAEVSSTTGSGPR